jgi:2-polyprenyl-3-methyl-5-hydroxy-6-metoxy-1,4-benzoquinol methylase
MNIIRRLFARSHTRGTSGSARPDTYAGNEASYWDGRHAELAGSLRAPGRKDRDEDANRSDYQTKRDFFDHHLPRWAPTPTDDGAPARLLDAGCGPGAFCGTWLDLGYRLTGVDFSRTAIDAARDAHPDAEFHVAPLDAPLPGAPYDVVVCIDVLFHVVDDTTWERALRHLAGAAKRRAPIVIQETLDQPQRITTHTRWRTTDHYARALAGLGMTIAHHERYALEHAGVTKDVLVARRHNA